MLYLSRDPHQELYLSYKQSVSALSVLLYFTPINVRIKHSSMIVLNKGIAQTVFFDEKCQQATHSITTLAFYNYPTTVL